MADEGVKVIVRLNGPYRVEGPIKVVDADGNEWEIKDKVVILCRCGRSSNKPFCDSTHRTVPFDAPTKAP